MEENRQDASVLTHVQKLAAEEHRLLEQGVLGDDEKKRLDDIQVELDQCWDLLRQRRALRETGQDPSAAHVRPPDVVEKYIG